MASVDLPNSQLDRLVGLMASVSLPNSQPDRLVGRPTVGPLVVQSEPCMHYSSKNMLLHALFIAAFFPNILE